MVCSVIVGEDGPIEQVLTALLAGGHSITLADSIAVPVGKYNELRFVITEACVLVAESGGDVWYASAGAGASLPTECAAAGSGAGTLRMPSYAQSGLKVTMPAAALVSSAHALCPALTGSSKK